jgi:hypothetical protein
VVRKYHTSKTVSLISGDIVASVFKTSLPNVMFRCDLISPRLHIWNALLQYFAEVQLTKGKDKFK